MPRVNPARRTSGRGVYHPIELNPQVQGALEAVKAGGRDGELAGRVWRVKDWERWGMAERLAFLRAFAQDAARDPAIATLAGEILREAGVKTRDYRGQWAALLKWVQRNITYVNEPNERLQSPQYTLTCRVADCDDMAILLMALGWSIRLTSRYVISGRGKENQRVRWIQDVGPCPPANYQHIYLCVGWPAFEPSTWSFAEPTLNVPLGWDVMTAPRDKHGRAVLPELAGAETSAPPPSSPSVASGPQGKGGLSRVRDGAVEVVKQIPWPQVLATVIGGVSTYYVTTQVLAKRRR